MSRTARTLASIAALVCAAAAHAQAMSAPDQEALHQRFLNGDTALAKPQAAALVAPGPIAQQLIYLGVEPSVAIARAAAQGERTRPARMPNLSEPAGSGDIYARNARAAAEKAMR